MRAYRQAMAAYLTFAGRTGRASFWQYILVVLLLSIVAHLADVVLKSGNLIYGVFCLVHFIPGWAVQVRRLHDVGRSGWWLLLIAIPLIGAIPLLVWCCSRSQPGPNRFDRLGPAAALPATDALPPEPVMGTAVPLLADTAAPSQSQAVQAQALRGRKITPLHAVLAVVGIGVGTFFLADANGIRLLGPSGPRCSDRAVTDLVQKFVRQRLAKTELQYVVDVAHATLTVQAIRTLSTQPNGLECAAHVTLDLTHLPQLDAAAQAAGLSAGWQNTDVYYYPKLTDDGKHVWVAADTAPH